MASREERHLTNDIETGNGGHAKNSPKEKPHFFRVAKSELLQQLSGNAVKVVLAVLKREDDLFYRQRVAFFNEELEELTGLSKRTVMQAREDAVNAGFLKYVPGSKSIRGIYSTAVPENIVATRPKTRSLFANQETDLESIEPESVSVAESDTESESSVAESDTESTVCMAESDTVSGVCMAEIDTHINPIPKTPSPFPEPSWGEVELRLSKTGLNSAAATIADARQRGYSAGTVAAIVAHYERHPGAWHSPGVIRNAVVNHPASLAADAPERWPQASQEFTNARHRQKQLERDAQDKIRRDAAREQAERERLEREKLERQFGALLDAMTEAELHELIHAGPNPESLANFVKLYGRKSSIVRKRLLLALQERMPASNAQIRAGPEVEAGEVVPDDLPVTLPFRSVS
jgi:hypothetical protein